MASTAARWPLLPLGGRGGAGGGGADVDDDDDVLAGPLEQQLRRTAQGTAAPVPRPEMRALMGFPEEALQQATAVGAVSHRPVGGGGATTMTTTLALPPLPADAGDVMLRQITIGSGGSSWSGDGNDGSSDKAAVWR